MKKLISNMLNAVFCLSAAVSVFLSFIFLMQASVPLPVLFIMPVFFIASAFLGFVMAFTVTYIQYTDMVGSTIPDAVKARKTAFALGVLVLFIECVVLVLLFSFLRANGVPPESPACIYSLMSYILLSVCEFLAEMSHKENCMLFLQSKYHEIYTQPETDENNTKAIPSTPALPDEVAWYIEQAVNMDRKCIKSGRKTEYPAVVRKFPAMESAVVLFPDFKSAWYSPDGMDDVLLEKVAAEKLGEIIREWKEKGVNLPFASERNSVLLLNNESVLMIKSENV